MPRILVLAPRGRDAAVAAAVIERTGMACAVCADLSALLRGLEEGAAAAVVTEEALAGEGVAPLLSFVERQPPWSDLPFIVLATRQAGPRPGARAGTIAALGNAVLLERPLNAETLASAARSAVRARRRQEQVREHIAAREAAAEALRAGEERLQQLNERLEARVAEEIAARHDAQARLARAQRMEALGQLAGGIAHDINNVLQAVTGGAQLIQRLPGSPEKAVRLARMITEAAERGSSVTRRLLSFARRDELRAGPVEPAALLAELADVLAHTLGAAIAVRVAAHPALPHLLADKGQLETVLINLATNARDAMPGGGTVTFRADPETVPAPRDAHGLAAGAYVRLAVEDTGTGMDAATLEHASEPFFTTKPVGQGTGLGLAMARGFAEQSGGALAIASRPDQGTVVTLWLPQVAAAPGPAPRTPAARGEGNGKARVLLVDDDPLVRPVLEALLESHGYAVAALDGGHAALHHLDGGAEVDLLVTDLSMPGMDGLALVREAQQRRPALPAILLTGYAGDGATLAVGGALSGSFSLLRKPVNGTQLAERAAALLEEVATRRAAAR